MHANVTARSLATCSAVVWSRDVRPDLKRAMAHSGLGSPSALWKARSSRRVRAVFVLLQSTQAALECATELVRMQTSFGKRTRISTINTGAHRAAAIDSRPCPGSARVRVSVSFAPNNLRPRRKRHRGWSSRCSRDCQSSLYPYVTDDSKSPKPRGRHPSCVSLAEKISPPRNSLPFRLHRVRMQNARPHTIVCSSKPLVLAPGTTTPRPVG
jgi:hypothetical protein